MGLLFGPDAEKGYPGSALRGGARSVVIPLSGSYASPVVVPCPRRDRQPGPADCTRRAAGRDAPKVPPVAKEACTSPVAAVCCVRKVLYANVCLVTPSATALELLSTPVVIESPMERVEPMRPVKGHYRHDVPAESHVKSEEVLVFVQSSKAPRSTACLFVLFV